jgi:hypothetical protein
MGTERMSAGGDLYAKRTLEFSRYQVRPAALLRYCGDDIRFRTRPWAPKQRHHNSRLRNGDPLSGPDFPVVWKRHAQEAA